MSNPDIAEIQGKLNAAGFDCGREDGVWGKKGRGALDSALALAALGRGQGPAPAPSPDGPIPARPLLGDPGGFFANLRARFGPLSQAQVDGINAILDACEGWPSEPTSYVLATAWHETGQTMQPEVENLNYSAQALISKFGHRISGPDAQRYGRTSDHRADQEQIANIIYGGAWGLKNLGNTNPGDGWLYRGRGDVQITGRGAYGRLGTRLQLDLVANPDLALRPGVAADILAVGMLEGLFTGRKLTEFITPRGNNFVGARSVVNPGDRAADVAGYAEQFLGALT